MTTGQPLPPPGSPKRNDPDTIAAVLFLGFVLIIVSCAVLGGWRWVGFALLAHGVGLVIGAVFFPVWRRR